MESPEHGCVRCPTQCADSGHTTRARRSWVQEKMLQRGSSLRQEAWVCTTFPFHSVLFIQTCGILIAKMRYADFVKYSRRYRWFYWKSRR